MELHLKKNEAAQIVIPAVNDTTPETFDTGETLTDTAYYSDSAGAWTTLAITDTFSEIGTTGVYVIDLTAGEMNHDVIMIKVTSTNMADSAVLIRTYANDIDDVATDIAALNDVSAADVNAQCDTALADYDGPTKAELDSGLAALNDLTAAQVNAECDTALSDYDPPTKAELDSGLAGLNDVSAADVNAQCDASIETYFLHQLFHTDYNPASKPGTATALLNELVEDDAGVSRYTANALEEAPTGGSAPTVGEIADAVWDEAASGHTAGGSFGEEVQSHSLSSEIAALNNVSTAEVNAQCDTALSDIGLDHLVSAAVTGTDITDDSIVAFLVSKEATADWDDFVNTTDSLQAIRDNQAGADVAAIADAVWDEAQADHVGAGTFGIMASEVASILVDTGEIGAAGAGLTAINLPNQTMDIVGSITGNLSGSVGSVTGAVGSVTGAVGSVTGDIGGLAAAAIVDVWQADVDTHSSVGTSRAAEYLAITKYAMCNKRAVTAGGIETIYDDDDAVYASATYGTVGGLPYAVGTAEAAQRTRYLAP